MRSGEYSKEWFLYFVIYLYICAYLKYTILLLEIIAVKKLSEDWEFLLKHVD